jgi:hypothetical protein
MRTLEAWTDPAPTTRRCWRHEGRSKRLNVAIELKQLAMQRILCDRCWLSKYRISHVAMWMKFNILSSKQSRQQSKSRVGIALNPSRIRRNLVEALANINISF